MVVLEFYRRFFWGFIVFLLIACVSSLKSLIQRIDFPFGYFAIGCFSQFDSLLMLFVMLVMILLGLIVLQPGLCWRFLGFIKTGFGSKPCSGEECESKNGFLENWYCRGDLEFNVMALRRLVNIEKQRANMAITELEKERLAASSAANEAMAMILRLQNEKSVIEIEANQYRRVAEKKQEFDKQVIESMQWCLMKHESEKMLMEDRLKVLREQLRRFVKDDELDGFEFDGVVAYLEGDDNNVHELESCVL